MTSGQKRLTNPSYNGILSQGENNMKTETKMGRPKKEFDKKQFEELCDIQCTEAEICSVLKTTDKTLVGWCRDTYDMTFSEIYKKLSEGGKTSLRRSMFHMARTNTGMAIWLSKQYLGMCDKNEVTNIVPDKDIKIEFITRPKVEK